MFIKQKTENGRIMNIGIPLPFDILLIIQNYLNVHMTSLFIPIQRLRRSFHVREKMISMIYDHLFAGTFDFTSRPRVRDELVMGYLYGYSLDADKRDEFFNTCYGLRNWLKQVPQIKT